MSRRRETFTKCSLYNEKYVIIEINLFILMRNPNVVTANVSHHWFSTSPPDRLNLLIDSRPYLLVGMDTKFMLYKIDKPVRQTQRTVVSLAKMMKAVKCETQTNKSSCGSERLFRCAKLNSMQRSYRSRPTVTHKWWNMVKERAKGYDLVYEFVLYTRV